MSYPLGDNLASSTCALRSISSKISTKRGSSTSSRRLCTTCDRAFSRDSGNPPASRACRISSRRSSRSSARALALDGPLVEILDLLEVQQRVDGTGRLGAVDAAGRRLVGTMKRTGEKRPPGCRWNGRCAWSAPLLRREPGPSTFMASYAPILMSNSGQSWLNTRLTGSRAARIAVAGRHSLPMTAGANGARGRRPWGFGSWHAIRL